MNKNTYIVVVILILVVIGGFFVSKSIQSKEKIVNIPKDNIVKEKIIPTNLQNNIVKDKNTSTDPQDIVPGLYKNLILNNSTISGLVILSGLVENNLDKDGKVTDDHLELVLKNTSTKDMNNFEAYYTITDLVNAKKEGYYKKLTGLKLKAGETKTIHFDRAVGENHYGINKDGLYYIGKNKMQFDVQVSTPDFKIATIQIKKADGGAELKD